MKRILTVLMAGLFVGAIGASYAKLPPAPAKSDAEKKAEADKAAAAKAKDAADLGKAQDRAVANYKKSKGGASMAPSKAKK
ncbi:MAG TPA: hypothetical protein VF004_00210 [Burkholderiales bacterium]